MGRPCKLTSEVEERICFALRVGNTRRAAVHFGGICEKTFENWMKKGQNGSRSDSKFVRFVRAIKDAEAACEAKCVLVIHNAMFKQWQAAAWWLERRRIDEWGRKEKVEITLRREAERLAQETGLDAAQIIAEAERLVGA